MPKNNEEFKTLMQEVLNGSESAAAELFRKYERHLLFVIRRRLNKRVRSKFDSLDIAQDVWKSFFAVPAPHRDFQNRGELITFLTKLARHKVVDVVRNRLATDKHDVRREQSLDDSHRFDKDQLPDASQATPSQIVMSQEEWRVFLGGKPLVYQQIFILLREGRTHDEIAQELKIHTKTVQRVVQRYFSRLPT